MLTRSSKSPQPPLLFLGCLALGWALGKRWPLGLGLPDLPRWAAGSGLMAVAGVLGAWGLLTFRRMGTTPEPNGVASSLLTSGPFRFTRNPLYLALSATLAAFGLLLDSAWVLLLAALLALLLDRFVIQREEARLRTQFGDTYHAYARRVRRWL
ncbi:MAG TPA: isoprenylcysteine carboxylmethyltransferase family protein [Geothrix sp.]|nr:isoprenylcysteine carboxylmethyltransferase family protein [Geothrix sp.]